MSYTGHVNWHRLTRTERPWIASGDAHTFVYAFIPVDYGRAREDHGVGLLKGEQAHPDWFLYADRADHVLAAYTRPGTLLSPNADAIFTAALDARPLLASMLIGTSNRRYHADGSQHGWHCADEDLTWRGRRLLKHLTRLYLREVHLITFVDPVTDEDSGPRDPR